VKKRKKKNTTSNYSLSKEERDNVRKFLYENEGKFLNRSLKKYYFKEESKSKKCSFIAKKCVK